MPVQRNTSCTGLNVWLRVRYHSFCSVLFLAFGTQLNTYFRETKWILKQLSWVTPNVHENEFHELVESIDSRAIVIQDTLRVERARRALVHLQTQLATE